jgi:hypothetical protein
LLDAKGRLCIVEVKKEGNPDTRKVVAQLLDYGAALWGLTVDEFERDVLRMKLGDDDPRTLREFIAEELVADADDPEEAAEHTLEELGETLRSGDFALVVAAPSIPAGVERVIEYLNARGQSVFGLEVSYFAGDVEAFVPRLVVRPTLGGRIAGNPVELKTPIDPDSYIASLPETAQDVVRDFLEQIEGQGGEVQWRSYGPHVRVRGASGPKVTVSMDADYLWIIVGPRKGIDPESQARAAERFRQIRGANVTDENATIRWNASSEDEIEAGLTVGRELVEDLVAKADAAWCSLAGTDRQHRPRSTSRRSTAFHAKRRFSSKAVLSYSRSPAASRA